MILGFKTHFKDGLRREQFINWFFKRREELSDIFFSKYVIASNLVEEKYIQQIDISDLSKKEYNDRLIMNKVEGGNYKIQVHSTHQLTN